MKKYIKYVIASIIFILIVFLLLWFNIPRINYSYNKETDTYEVVGAYGNAKSYNIKNEINGKSVTKIDTRAFYRHSNLESVSLPDTITYISRLAFSECKKLTTINLDNIITIERNAFSYCYLLNDISLKAENIGASAFYKCTSLDTLSLNDGIINIGDMAFSETKVKKVSIPRSVKVFGNDVFLNCYALAQINVYGYNLVDNEYLNSLNIVNYIG